MALNEQNDAVFENYSPLPINWNDLRLIKRRDHKICRALNIKIYTTRHPSRDWSAVAIMEAGLLWGNVYLAPAGHVVDGPDRGGGHGARGEAPGGSGPKRPWGTSPTRRLYASQKLENFGGAAFLAVTSQHFSKITSEIGAT